MKPNPFLSAFSCQSVPRRFGAFSIAAAGLLTAFTPAGHAMQIVCDMNTLPVAQYTTVGADHCAGSWCVFNNNPTSSQVSSVINNLGTGMVIAENTYPGLGNYNTAKSSGHTPTAAFSYHETGSQIGGTILTTSEIDSLKGQIGGSSVIVLTRGYHGGWVAPLNAALADANCSGVAYEIAPYYTNTNNPDIVACTNYCVSQGKSIYLLFAYQSGGGTDYYDQLRSEFEYLLQHGANLADNHVILVVSNYNPSPCAWTGSEGSNSVQGAEIWAAGQNTWPGRYYFTNQYSQLQMGIAGGSTSNNAVVDQSTAQASANHQWYLLYATGGHYNITDCNSNLAASVQGDGTGDGNPVVQFSLSAQDGSTGQLWTPQLSGSIYLFYNETNGKVLDDHGSNTSGTGLIQTAHTGNPTQFWTLTAVQ